MVNIAKKFKKKSEPKKVTKFLYEIYIFKNTFYSKTALKSSHTSKQVVFQIKFVSYSFPKSTSVTIFSRPFFSNHDHDFSCVFTASAKTFTKFHIPVK